MNATEMEAYVRERWEEMSFDPLYGADISNAEPFDGGMISKHFGSIFAAYNFTIGRERQIAEVREEIAALNSIHLEMRLGQGRWTSFKRILAREQAVLDSLTAGMKEPHD
jgi:hypothetical protein